MKTGIIADLHGKNVWKDFVKENPNIDWVFTGDYVDSFDKTNEEIITNLVDVINFKKQNPNKVTLLLGNHDVPYYYLQEIVKYKANIPYTSGFDFAISWDLFDIFDANRELFKVAHQKGTTLFTHAGVSEAWFKEYEEVIMSYWKQNMSMTLADVLNGLTKTSKRSIIFRVGESRGGVGYGGITWACQEETKHGTINGYNQYVGHTRQRTINTIRFNETTSITYCDVLSTIPEYLILDL